MLCFLCGKKIGLWRSLADQQYCSSEHRQEARMASAQAVRDEEDVESWAVERSRKKNKKAAAKPNSTSAGHAASIFAFLGVGALLVAALLLPGPQSGPSSFPAVSTQRSAKQGILERAGDAVGGFLRSNAPVTLQQTFNGGGLANAASTLRDWTSINLRTTSGRDEEWTGGSRANLRLWTRSTTLQNYQMEFQGQLEKSSLHWAVRASDGANYYATRLAIIKPGSASDGPNAGVIRYTMVDGRESDRIQTAIPVTLKQGVDYRVRVTVQDDRIVTYLNGQYISSLVDKRLTRGGVGFFEDNNDPQKVSWVSLSERDSFLGRMLAHFSLFIVPGNPAAIP